jgi:hypothetical protein
MTMDLVDGFLRIHGKLVILTVGERFLKYTLHDDICLTGIL